MFETISFLMFPLLKQHKDLSIGNFLLQNRLLISVAESTLLFIRLDMTSNTSNNRD